MNAYQTVILLNEGVSDEVFLDCYHSGSMYLACLHTQTRGSGLYHWKTLIVRWGKVLIIASQTVWRKAKSGCKVPEQHQFCMDEIGSHYGETEQTN